LWCLQCCVVALRAGVGAGELVDVGFADRSLNGRHRREGPFAEQFALAAGEEHLGNARRGQDADVPRAAVRDVGEAFGFALRPLVADDREPFLRSIDHEVRYWQGFDERPIETYTAMFEALGKPRVPFIVRYLALVRDGELVGNYSLRPRPNRSDRRAVELGCWLAPEVPGQGLGRASLAAVLDHVHRDLRVPVALLGTEIDNVRAIGQIEAVGATPVREERDTLPDGRELLGRWYHHRADAAVNAADRG
jgi:RimJ/RimL family protein N-acetyltransferase